MVRILIVIYDTTSNMRLKTSQFNVHADVKLALGIIFLWSVGRVLNPLRHLASQSAQGVGFVLNAGTVFYVLLHLGVFVYCCMLIWGYVRKNGIISHKRSGWELLLYIYVLLSILVSLYFIAYEFGYLPGFLVNLLPYSIVAS